MMEFHAVLFDRERLVELGGPDERLLSQGEHLDLALKVHDAGGTVWFEPRGEVTFQVPSKLKMSDLPFFLGRWSPKWNRASERAMCTLHGITDPAMSPTTWAYPDLHRRYAWSGMLSPLVPLIGKKWVGRSAKAFDLLLGRYMANAVLELSPSWRGGGLEIPERADIATSHPTGH
jgi:hypothetical protein